MKVNNINSAVFRGPLDGVVTSALRTCDMNEMVNAVGLDVGAMVIPRAYYDTKARNEYAGAETFIREISGTFINCLSAGLFANDAMKAAALEAGTDMANLTWGNFFATNLLPVTLGNIIGGAVLVGVMYWYIYLSQNKGK